MKEQQEEINGWIESRSNDCFKTEEEEQEEDDLEKSVSEAQQQSDEMRESANSLDLKIEAANAMKRLKELKTRQKDFKESIAHKLPHSSDSGVSDDDVHQLERKASAWEAKVRKTEAVVRNKDETKEVSLGTSKINYMDPRITVAWCKRVRLL